MSTAKVREAQIGPSISSIACSAVTPQSRFCIRDRPVQRGRSAVAPGTGMDHDRGIRRPHLLGHPVTQERADHHVRLDGRDRRPERVVATRHLHGDLVPGRLQLGPRPLGQAVERRAEQHDPTAAAPRRGSSATMGGSAPPNPTQSGARVDTRCAHAPPGRRCSRAQSARAPRLSPAVGASRRVRHRVSPSTNGAPWTVPSPKSLPLPLTRFTTHAVRPAQHEVLAAWAAAGT